MDIRHFNIRNFFKKESFSWYFALIYLLVITVPFNHKEAFSVYNPDLIWSKFVLSALAIVGLYYFVKNYKTYIRDPFLLLLLSFVVFQILSLIQTRDITSSLSVIVFQTAIAFSYIPVRNFMIARKNGLGDLISIYSVMFIPVTLFLVLQIYLQTNFEIAIGGVWPVPGYPTRYGATFWDINHFGAYCSALSLILIGSTLSKGLTNRHRIFNVVILFFTLSSLYLTSSRSSLLGFIAGLTVLIILALRNPKFSLPDKLGYQAWYLGILSFISIFLYGIYTYADSLKASMLYRSVSFFSHLFLLKVGIIVGIQNAFLGIGANSFHAYFRETEWAQIYYYIDRAALNLKLPLHNLWLEVLAETGLVSFIFFTAFWILLLIGLYRIYSDNSDKLALGLMSGIISFLVGGFMYSYKSEFFWLFVLISAAYVSRYYFVDKKIHLIASVNKIICPENCDVKKVMLSIISASILITPLIFITHPLNAFEVKFFSGAFESNLLTDTYTKLLVLFRYIIGNYTYTGRLLSFVFYAGSIVLAFLILKRYAGKYCSFIIISLIVGLANMWEPAMIVSIKWFAVFSILVAAGFFILLMSFVNTDTKFLRFNRKADIFLLIFALLILVGAGMSNYSYFKKSYSEDLTFLLELAYNRRFMDQALIQVSDDIDLNGIYYFSDEIRKNAKGLYNMEGTVIPISGYDLDNYNKNLYIYSDLGADKVKELTDILRENPLYEVNELNQGEYKLTLIEKRSSPSY